MKTSALDRARELRALVGTIALSAFWTSVKQGVLFPWLAPSIFFQFCYPKCRTRHILQENGMLLVVVITYISKGRELRSCN